MRYSVLQVSDLGAVLHMVGGTAASFMIFFLPGLLLINAAIVKHQDNQDTIEIEVRPACTAAHLALCLSLAACPACVLLVWLIPSSSWWVTKRAYFADG